MALRSGASDVTVAEGNRGGARRLSQQGHHATSPATSSSKVRVIDYEGRLFLAHTDERFDIVDLSLADSVGLSNPGGFAIVEKYSYTREAMETYMRALADGGVLSVTLWNKEEPPKSVLKLYATMAAAGARRRSRRISPIRSSSPRPIFRPRRCCYKRGGFTADEIAKLREHTHDMSFDEIYSPGLFYDSTQTDRTLDDYVAQIFSGAAGGPTAPTPTTDAQAGADPTAPADPTGPPIRRRRGLARTMACCPPR